MDTSGKDHFGLGIATQRCALAVRPPSLSKNIQKQVQHKATATSAPHRKEQCHLKLASPPKVPTATRAVVSAQPLAALAAALHAASAGAADALCAVLELKSH